MIRFVTFSCYTDIIFGGIFSEKGEPFISTGTSYLDPLFIFIIDLLFLIE